MKKRIALLLYMNIKPVQGTYPYERELEIAEELALEDIRERVEEQLGQFNPIVSHAPDSLQPSNPKYNGEPTKADIRKVKRTPEHSGEIPAIDDYLPKAGPSNFTTTVDTADVAMTYNEGNA